MYATLLGVWLVVAWLHCQLVGRDPPHNQIMSSHQISGPGSHVICRAETGGPRSAYMNHAGELASTYFQLLGVAWWMRPAEVRMCLAPDGYITARYSACKYCKKVYIVNKKKLYVYNKRWLRLEVGARIAVWWSSVTWWWGYRVPSGQRGGIGGFVGDLDSSDVIRKCCLSPERWWKEWCTIQQHWSMGHVYYFSFSLRNFSFSTPILIFGPSVLVSYRRVLSTEAWFGCGCSRSSLNTSVGSGLLFLVCFFRLFCSFSILSAT